MEELINNYFTTSLSTSLVCDENTVINIYDESRSSYVDEDSSELIFNSNQYEEEHNKYSNKLQLYYSLLKQNKQESTENLNENTNLINIRNLTPLLVQRTESILSTLLFIALDQNHDFRGGRTAGSDSWVTVKNPTFISTIRSSNEGTVIDYPMNNSYLNTLVNTSFSGLKSLIGLLVIDIDDAIKLEEMSKYIKDGKIDINEIMKLYNFNYNITPVISGFDINMKGCSPDGNNIELNDTGISISFLSFAQSTWDHGMHNIWTFDKKKSIYLVQLKSLTITDGILQPIYDIYKYTILENIVPIYECYYANGTGGEVGDFSTLALQNSGISGKYKSANTTNEDLDNYYKFLLNYLKMDSLNRGAVLKFHSLGKAAKDQLSLFHDLCKKIGININPKVCDGYNVPKNIESTCENTDEFIDIYSEIDNCKKDDGEKDVINKLFGSVNDSNIAVEEKNIIFRNLNYPPIIEGKLGGGHDSDDYEDKTDKESITTQENALSILPSRVKTSSSDFSISKNCADKVTKTRICSEFIENIIESNNPNCIEDYYPIKFQLNSGVIDSSGLGGQNMAQFFAPDIDIFMTIFSNDTTPKLLGAILKLTFLKQILTNVIGEKNNAEVFCHLTYISFDEINLDCPDLSSNNSWQIDYNKYPLALRQLILYAANSTFYDTNSINNKITNFKIKINSGFKNWYYFVMSTVGPSVKNINKTVQKITKKFFDWIEIEDEDLINSIVRVSQRIYKDNADNSTSLRQAFPPNFTTDPEYPARNTFFEAIFFLRIKYLGDKSRCTDSIFLNTNKMIEPLQVTLDENAYFTALMNGASTLFSTELKTCMYFAPYLTFNNQYIKIPGDKNNIELKKNIFQAVNPSEPVKLVESKPKVLQTDSDKIYSNLFYENFSKESESRKPNPEIPCEWLVIKLKTIKIGFNPYHSMKILNAESSDESGINIYDVPISYLSLISTTNAVLESYQYIIDNFMKDLEELFISVKDDTLNKLISDDFQIECGEALSQKDEPFLDKLDEFIQDFKTINEVNKSGSGNSVEGIRKSFLPQNILLEQSSSSKTSKKSPDSGSSTSLALLNYPEIERNFFNCFKSGINFLAKKTNILSTSYESTFKQEEIREQYKILSYNLTQLINENIEEQKIFVETAQKMKFDIINDLIESLIVSFKSSLEFESSIISQVNKDKIKNNIKNIIQELENIRIKELPISIKEATLIMYFNTINKIYDSLKELINKPKKATAAVAKSYEDALNNIWPINNVGMNYKGAIEILNCIRDYNNLFSEISSAVISNVNYEQLIQSIFTTLNQSNIIISGVPDKVFNFKAALDKLLKIYKKTEEYLKCLDKEQKEPVFIEKKQVVTTPTEIKITKPKKITPKVEIPAEEIPAEVIPAEEIPAEKIPAEEIPAEVIPTEIKPLEIKPAEEIPAEIKAEIPVIKKTEGESRRSRIMGKQRVGAIPPTTTGGKILVERQPFIAEKEQQRDESKIISSPDKIISTLSEKKLDETYQENKFDENYKKNKIAIINNFIELMSFYNNKYKDLINQDKINFSQIKSINTLLIAITFLSINNELKLYNLNNLENLISVIKDSLLKASTLDEVLHVRYFYDSFYSNIILIDSFENNNNSEENIEYFEGGGTENELKILLIKLKNYVKKIEFINSKQEEINYVFISNYNVILKLFNELYNLDFIYLNQFSDNYDIFIYLVLFTIKYCNDLLYFIYPISFENGYNHDFNEISNLLDKLNKSEYKNILNSNVKIDEKPSIGYLNNILSNSNKKEIYLDTNNSLENATRVYVSIFIENIKEKIIEDELNVSSSGGKKTRKYKAIQYKKFTRNIKDKKNKLTRKKKLNKKRKNTKKTI